MGHDDRDAPDDVPPTHVLEAMEAKDKKETADLLAGFDRPGRTPRRAPPARDFVDYYAKKSGRSAEREPAREAPPSPRERATMVVPRKRDTRTFVLWAAAVLGMILFGAFVAVLATPEPPKPRAMPTIVPSSATTITSAPAAPGETAERDDEVAPMVIVGKPPDPRPAKTAPATTAGSSASTGAATTIKTAPRDDFIRDL